MTSRQRVFNTLNGKNIGRTARQLWHLPWARIYYKDALAEILNAFPADIVGVDAPLKERGIKTVGDMHEPGIATDAWGCIFENRQRGTIGEVKTPIVTDDEWKDVSLVHIPEEQLSFDINEANANIEKYGKDKFTIAACLPRPFEQLQFIRGSENLYMDLADPPKGLFDFMEKMHDFYCRLLKKWVKTNVDGINFMDDWGSQKSLLINPKAWSRIFRPMYRDYIDIAKSAGKKTFMHSDGYTLDIIPDLIDIGLDAFNAQIFCIGLDKLKQFKGRITFWGEIDRQHLLPRGTKQDIKNAVRQVYETLYAGGYCVAQCEFGPGAKPENVREVFSMWDELTK